MCLCIDHVHIVSSSFCGRPADKIKKMGASDPGPLSLAHCLITNAYLAADNCNDCRDGGRLKCSITTNRSTSRGRSGPQNAVGEGMCNTASIRIDACGTDNSV